MPTFVRLPSQHRLNPDVPATLFLYRAKIPGGWLVGFVSSTDNITFVPDPQHQWDGSSLP